MTPPWHAPKTWKPGDVRLNMTATVLNHEIRDQLRYLYDNIAALIPPNEDWTAPTFTDGWLDYVGAGASPAGFYKDPWGRVHLRGLIDSGSVPGDIFTLPSGYRPDQIARFLVADNAAYGRIQVLTSGIVHISAGTAPISLDGISFREDL